MGTRKIILRLPKTAALRISAQSATSLHSHAKHGNENAWERECQGR
ncbi:MAG: hypothetical protein GY749_36530 [Desulfobacteraceae bacterium]|nr:hypothetical protein [Desulfobacteraceae bacterium]